MEETKQAYLGKLNWPDNIVLHTIESIGIDGSKLV